MPVKIVVIDDEIEIAKLLRIKLEREGYEVFLARDGQEGLQLAETVRPDLVLLDVVMPGKDGYEVLNQLKEGSATKNIPVILLTGKAFDDDIQKGLESQADDYITKPFHSELIMKRIENVLDRP